MTRVVMATPDFWQKLADVSGLTSGIVVALIGGTATYIIAQRQRRADDHKAGRELAVHRVQTVQAFITNLGSKDEREKEAALLAINALGDPDLASKLATIYGGEGSAAAMSRIAAVSTGPEASNAEQTLAILFDSMRESVVQVISGTTSDKTAWGTGFVASPNRIITVAHVVEENQLVSSIRIQSRDGKETPGTVVHLDRNLDLALIEMDTRDLVPLKLANQQQIAEEVTAVGYGASGHAVKLSKPGNGGVVELVTEPTWALALWRGYPTVQVTICSMPSRSGV